MTGITHRLAGITAGIVIINSVPIKDISAQAIMIGGCILGSLIPDIDNPQSTISYKIPLLRGLIGTFQQLIRLLSNLLPRKQKEYVRSCIGHRGITHSLLAALGLPLIVNIVGNIFHVQCQMFSLGLAVGLLSHIILDLFSGGTRLLLPISAKVFKIMKLHTNGICEWFVRAALICLIVILFRYK